MRTLSGVITAMVITLAISTTWAIPHAFAVTSVGTNISSEGTITSTGDGFVGDGSALTNLEAGNVATGTLADARLSALVTLLGNTFNGISQLVQLDVSGFLPILNGSALTNLTAANISAGTAGIDITGNSATVTTNANLTGDVTSVGNATTLASIPAISGANLTGITATQVGLDNVQNVDQTDADNITSGTLTDGRLSANVTLLGNIFNGISQLVQLDAGGLLPILNGSALTNLTSGNLVGALPALDGSALTSLTAANISAGTAGIDITGSSGSTTGNAATVTTNANLTGDVTSVGNATTLATIPAISGANLTSLNATNISSGTLADARLSALVTLLGNTFNGISQLVQLDAGGLLPILNGSALTNITAANISAGTAGIDITGNSATVTTNANLTGDVTSVGNATTIASIPAISGANLTSLNATNISSGTLADARLSALVTLLGNTFNGISQLVQLDVSGFLPILNGSALTNLTAANISAGTASIDITGNAATVTTNANLTGDVTSVGNATTLASIPAISGANLTSLNATNISSGTLADARLSTLVTLLGNTFNGISQLVQLDAGGLLPILNGSALTNLTAANISAGTAGISVTGNAGTATALAANGANCGAGEAPRGVDASGAAENCTPYLGSALPDGDIFVGNGSGVATAVTMSGDATISNTGVVTVSSGLHAYAMFYGLTTGTGNAGPNDYAATVAVGAAVPFPRDGAALGGIVSTTDTTFTIPDAGTYEVTFHVHTSESGQLQLRVDGVAVDECIAANLNPTAGGHPIVGNCLITLGAASVLEVINPAGNSTALTITPADGASTHANSQTLVIKKL